MVPELATCHNLGWAAANVSERSVPVVKHDLFRQEQEQSWGGMLVIFRAEPSIDALIRTFVPSKCVLSLVPRQSSTNFSMTDPGEMNNHI